jgi:hypothetical protein
MLADSFLEKSFMLISSRLEANYLSPPCAGQQRRLEKTKIAFIIANRLQRMYRILR